MNGLCQVCSDAVHLDHEGPRLTQYQGESHNLETGETEQMIIRSPRARKCVTILSIMGSNASFIACSVIITGLRLTLVNQYKVDGAEDFIATTAVVTGTIWVVCRAWAVYFRKVSFPKRDK